MSVPLSPTIHSSSPEETIAEGTRLGARLAAEFPRGAVVLLVGPLGAGKTVLAGGIARGLGIDERLVSPTYTIISEYRAGSTLLHHVDLYRIEGRDQMENLGLQDILAGTGYVLVEWGEKMAALAAPGAALAAPGAALAAPGAALAAHGTSLSAPGAAAHLRVTLSIAADGGRDIMVEEVAA